MQIVPAGSCLAAAEFCLALAGEGLPDKNGVSQSSASWAWRICISPSDVGQDDSLHANAKLVRFSSRQLDDTIIGLRSRLCRADVVSGRILSLYDKAIDLNT